MTKPLSEVCKELLDLHAKATEGPWVSQGTGMSPDHMADMNILRSHNRTPYISHEDTNYIVAARDHLERICKALLRCKESPTDKEIEDHLSPAPGCVVEWGDWDDGFREGVRWANAMQRISLKEGE